MKQGSLRARRVEGLGVPSALPPMLARARADRKRTIHSMDNAKVVLTCEPVDAAARAGVVRAVMFAKNVQAAYAAIALMRRLEVFPTEDPRDRAHAAMDRGMLAENDAHAPIGKPRRYHRDQLTIDVLGRRVSWDSAFDAWAVMRKPLEAAGITLAPSATMAALVRGAMAMTPAAYRRVRDLIEQPTRQSGMTEEERRLSRAASDLLRGKK